MFQLNLKDHSPLYQQIKEQMKTMIISGALKADEKIPSVRELAQMLTINPNTIQKAYKELEQEVLSIPFVPRAVS
jgi:GntR family transcriptional regulator